MITVHHLNASRSQRILWMLEELGVPYEIKPYRRLPSMQAPPELRAVHPLGKSPVITDGDRTVAESGAILEYLIDSHGGGGLRPAPGTEEHRRYTYFMHYAEGSLMPLLVMKLIFSRIPGRVPFLLRPVARMISGGADRTLLAPQIASHFAFLEGELGGRDWFAGGEFTAADIQMSFPIEAAAARVGLGDRLPKLQAFLDRIRARPAYKRAAEKGGASAPLR
ncbi:MAG: glutathione S-transferase [Enhydrobacter sp.]|nr:MAG: glutathione S-transferase [Enhydrobacter sp.]